MRRKRIPLPPLNPTYERWTTKQLIGELEQACVFSATELELELAARLARTSSERRQIMTDSVPTPFDDYEIHGVKTYGEFCEPVDDAESEFWSLYGHIPGEGVICIGDFSSRAFAEEVYWRIIRHSVAVSSGVECNRPRTNDHPNAQSVNDLASNDKATKSEQEVCS